MFDTATCTEAAERWDAWQRDAELHAGAFGDLTEPPGPDLAGALAMWDPTTRADDELIDRIGSWEKITAWAQAGQLAEIAELARRRRAADQRERAEHAARGEPGQLSEFLVDEIALAARTSRVTASTRLDLAQDLTAALPQVFEALQDGSIDLTRARIVTEATRGLDRDLRAAVAEKVLVKAPGQTPSTLRAAVARAVCVIDPTGAEDRHQIDLTRRRVTLTPRENGMSELWALLPADGAAAIMATLHRLAETSHTPHDNRSRDHRSADQRRADALIDLATNYLDTHPGLRTPSTSPAQRRPPAWAQVQVVLPANLLTGHGKEPAELLGYGPIPTAMALGIAADATWQRLLTDPVSGALTEVWTHPYHRPTPTGRTGNPTRTPRPATVLSDPPGGVDQAGPA